MEANGEGEGQLSTVDAGMARERTPTDPIAMERARARIERTMFGEAPPARLGRFVILDAVARGGMGVVYAAYDPDLDRRVALKVLHPSRSNDSHAHERLLLEARALARLEHPNVVKVHDVLVHDRQIVVVMTLLDGDTLAAWENTPHHWRDVLAAYLQAGEGLAAAHSVDVIHRDFKPSNAIIGPTGDVQVLDFGLAHMTRDDSDLPGVRAELRAQALPGRTISGAFIGTPEYASPEQLAGEQTTTSSDQFSFCVALHRAIERVPPFSGHTIAELRDSIRRGALQTAKGPNVPAWLRHALRRGLQADPAQRFESMQSLLAVLRRPRGWQRWRWPVSTAALVIGASFFAAVIENRAGNDTSCGGDAAALLGSWDVMKRAQLGAHLSVVAGADARDVEKRVLDGLDAEVRKWSLAYRDVCQAHRRGEDTDRLLELKMRCLTRQRNDIAAAVGVLEQTTNADVVRAVDVVVGLPPAAWCQDASRVSEDADPPATAALDERVQAVRSQIGRAAALERNGRSDEAAAGARSAIRDAELTAYRPVIAEAALQLGRTLIGREQLTEAVPVLRHAFSTALATGRQARLAVEAGARLIYAEGIQRPNLEALRRDLLYLLPMSQALGRDRFARPLLLNNIGEVYRLANEIDDARHYFALAHDALTGEEPVDIELAVIDRNLATLTADPSSRLELARSSWTKTRDMLGAHHLRTLQAQVLYAVFQTDAAKAYQLFAPVCDEYERSYGALVVNALDCELVRGFLAAELGDLDAARRAYGAIVAKTVPISDPDLTVYRQLGEAELARLDQRFDRAVTEYQAVIATHGHSEFWWERQHALQAELGLGIIAVSQHRSHEAFEHLEIAANGYAGIFRIYPGIMYSLRSAGARDLLAARR